MILGTDKPFEVSGRRRLKIKQKIKRNHGEKESITEELVEAVALLTGAMEFCVVPSQATNDQHMQWYDQVLPYLDMSEDCDDEIILQTLKRRDPLNIGLSLMKEYDAIDFIQLLRSLLRWDPTKRVTAAEALQLPVFEGMSSFSTSLLEQK